MSRQALAPSIGALLLDLGGDNAVLGVLLGAALCNVVPTFALYRR